MSAVVTDVTEPQEPEPTLEAEQVASEVAPSGADEEWMDADKPRLRGVSHAAMTLLTLAGGLILIFYSRGGAQVAAVSIYMATGLLLFGVSAVYHLGMWNQRRDRVLQQMDHSNIFVFIAGTYTPLAIGLLGGANRVVLVSVIWGIALLGVLLGAFALKTPRWVQAGLYIIMGWIAVGWMPVFWINSGPTIPLLLLLGGIVYTLGAVVYAKKWPDPAPQFFGYHEIFHACTVIAAILHWVAIFLAIR